MKKVVAYGVVVLCAIILVQYVFVPYFETGNGRLYHPFSQDPRNVESLEIYKSLDQWHENHALWKIPEEKSAKLLFSQIQELTNKGMILEPPTNFGLYVIKIMYHDGTMELLGETNRMTVSPDGGITYGYHNYDGTMNQLIEEVLKQVPEFEGPNHLLRDHLPQNDIEYENIDDWKERYQNGTSAPNYD